MRVDFDLSVNPFPHPADQYLHGLGEQATRRIHDAYGVRSASRHDFSQQPVEKIQIRPCGVIGKIDRIEARRLGVGHRLGTSLNDVLFAPFR